MKSSVFVLLGYYFLIKLTEYSVESRFYNYDAGNWDFIVISETFFSTLVVLPIPVILDFLLTRTDRSGTTELASSKSKLTLLLAFSLVALIAVPIFSYRHVLEKNMTPSRVLRNKGVKLQLLSGL